MVRSFALQSFQTSITKKNKIIEIFWVFDWGTEFNDNLLYYKTNNYFFAFSIMQRGTFYRIELLTPYLSKNLNYI